MTVAEAILDCRGRIERSRLLEAARDARKEGLLTRDEYAHVQRQLRDVPSADTVETTAEAS